MDGTFLGMLNRLDVPLGNALWIGRSVRDRLNFSGSCVIAKG